MMNVLVVWLALAYLSGCINGQEQEATTKTVVNTTHKADYRVHNDDDGIDYFFDLALKSMETRLETYWSPSTEFMNVTYMSGVLIPYFSGIELYFVEDTDKFCTNELVSYLTMYSDRINRTDLINYFFKKPECITKVVFTRDLIIISDFSSEYHKGSYVNLHRYYYRNYRGLLLFSSTSCYDRFLSNIMVSNISIFLNTTARQINSIKTIQKCTTYYSLKFKDFPQPISNVNFWIFVVHILLTVIIVPMNMLVLYVFGQLKKMKPVMILLSALAVTDTCTALLISLHSFLSPKEDPMEGQIGILTESLWEYKYVIRFYVQHFSTPLINVFHLLSACFTCGLSLQKIVVVIFPVWSKVHMTKRVSVLIIILSISVSLIAEWPILYYVYASEYYNCGGLICKDIDLESVLILQSFVHTYNIVDVVYLALTFLLVFTTVVLVIKLIMLRKKVKHRTQSRANRKSLRSAVIVFFICVTFLCSEGMRIVIAMDGGQIGEGSLVTWHIYYLLYQIEDIPIMVGFAANFFIYIMMGKEIRQMVCNSLKCASLRT